MHVANFPGPAEVRIFYTTNEPAIIADHVVRISMELSVLPPTPGLTFDAYTAPRAGGGTVALDAWVDDFVVLLKPLFNTATDIVRAELWYYDPGTFNSAFVSVYPIDEPGTAAGATVIAGQAIWTLRTTAGGIFKLDLRGTFFTPGAALTFPTANSDVNAIAAFFNATTNPAIGRDNGYPFAGVKFLAGQNERAWKKVNR